jgi:predicted negative regulator of RcsB-dependent stress response
MNNDIIFLVEMILVFGLVLGWAVWELVKLNQDKKKDAEKARDEDPS